MNKQTLLSLILIICMHLSFAQSNEITIRFIGNCGLHLTDGITNIYTDFPYKSGFNQYMEYNDAELDSIKDNSIFIFTHKHPDHYSKKRMKTVLKVKGGEKFGFWDIEELVNLSHVIPDFKITAFKTKHFLSKRHYSYLIEWHGKTLYFSGDTEYADVILSIKEIDLTFIPAWIFREVYVTQKKQVDSEKVIIYHIGLKDIIDIQGEQFLMLNKQGEIISIPYE